MATFIRFIEPNKIYYRIKLYQSMTSSFQVTGTFLSRWNSRSYVTKI